MPRSPHPVDEILPLPKLFALGLQHLLVMYANAVAGPVRRGASDFGTAGYIMIAALALGGILRVIKYASGFLQNVAVLIRIAVGYVVTIALGRPDFSGIQNEPLLRAVLPVQFGMPQFHLPQLTMCPS